MPVTGPDFISLQTRDLDASQAFYEQYLGLVRSQAGPPHAVVFEPKPIAFPHPPPSPVSAPRSGSTPPTSRPFTMLSSPAVTPSSPRRSTAPLAGHLPSPTPTATRSLCTTAPDRPDRGHQRP